jgi:hypothetical protein
MHPILGNPGTKQPAQANAGAEPDGWDCARFLELVLSYGSFPFLSIFSAAALTRVLREGADATSAPCGEITLRGRGRRPLGGD